MRFASLYMPNATRERLCLNALYHHTKVLCCAPALAAVVDGETYVARTPDDLRPAILLYTELKSGNASIVPVEQELDVFDTVASLGEFSAGYVVGLTKGGIGVVTGVLDFIKAVPSAIAGGYHYLQDLGVRYVDGDTYEQEMAVAAKTWAVAKVLAKVAYALQHQQYVIVDAIYAGSYEPLTQVSPEFQTAVEVSVELMKELGQEFSAMSDYDAGEASGRAMFEIVSIVLPIVKAAQVSKLAVLTKMEQTATFLERVVNFKYPTTPRYAA